MRVQIVNHLGPAQDAAAVRIAEVGQQYADLICAKHDMAKAQVMFKPNATTPDDGCFALGLFETPDVADALGYHDVDPRGLPYGKAFLSVVPKGVILRDPSGHGASLAGVVMHELAEMLGDRYANLWAFGQIADPSHPRRVFGAIAYELADPVQDSAFVLKSNDGTEVDCSDFVLPEYFNPDTSTAFPTSYTGAAKGPFKVAPGGYAIVGQASGQTQIFGWRIGGKPKAHETLVHADVPPPAWREASRALKYSRANRRVRHLG